MNTPVIENWSFTVTGINEYSAPEQGISRFQGNVYKHPNYENGHPIQSSKILGYDEETDEFICLSRRYKLGQVDVNYEKLYPNAKERLIEQLLKSF